MHEIELTFNAGDREQAGKNLDQVKHVVDDLLDVLVGLCRFLRVANFANDTKSYAIN